MQEPTELQNTDRPSSVQALPLELLVSELQRLHVSLDERTRKATFNISVGILVTLAPLLAFAQGINQRWFMVGPAVLSVMPMAMLEEDKETRAIGVRISQLEDRVNSRLSEPLFIMESEVARRNRLQDIGLSRFGLYGMFLLILLGSWSVGMRIAFTDTHVAVGLRYGYVALFILVVVILAVGITSRDEISKRVHRAGPTNAGRTFATEVGPTKE